jgi:hypothetical protein
VPRVTHGAVSRAVNIMRNRLVELGLAAPEISARTGNRIFVRLPNSSGRRRAIQEVGTTARLELYDWEGNVLLPNGKTVASLGPELSSNQQAITPIQGGARAAPGSSGAGSVNLYKAVRLASERPVQISRDNAREGPQYYMFGAPSSRACTIAGKAYGFTPAPGEHCLLSGPVDNAHDLYNSLPHGISRSEGQELVVPQGTNVLQATPANFSHPPSIWDPTTQFYVLRTALRYLATT